MSAPSGTNNAGSKLLDCHCYAVNDQFGTFLNYALKHKADLIDSIQRLPKEEAEAQVELALTFMQHYMTLEDDGLLDKPESKHRILIDRRKSPFEILLDLHASMRATCVGFNLYFYGDNAITEKFIELLLQFGAFTSDAGDQLALTADIPLHSAFCTMVVFDSCDLESASDRLATAWSTNNAPWAIRRVLVQENIKDEFVELIKSKLKPFNESQMQFFQGSLIEAVDAAMNMGALLVQSGEDVNDVKPTIALVPGLQCLIAPEPTTPQFSPIMTMDVFRTAKEAVSLVNSYNGGSVSLWTEELSLSLEIAYGLHTPTVWVNSYAQFNPDCPYSFRKEDFCYGSDYAICEKKVKLVFAPSVAQPLNSAERNRVALKKIGPFVAESRYKNCTVQLKSGVHYEIISSPVKVNEYDDGSRLTILDNFWDTYVSLDDFEQRCFLQDTVCNQRKVICIPYGVTFAN